MSATMSATSAAGKPIVSSHIPDLEGITLDNGRLILRHILGRGAWGVVYLAETANPPPGEEPKRFAVKCVVTKNISDDHFTNLAREVVLLGKCSSASEHILTLHDVIGEEDGDLAFLVTDYCENDLLTALNSNQIGGQIDSIKSIFLQLLDAVEACHDLEVYHRDIKPENILLTNDGTKVVLADFGFATSDKWSKEFGIGTPEFMSPECLGGFQGLTGQYPTAEGDIWALGVVLVNLVSGHLPWTKAALGNNSFWSYLTEPEDFWRKFSFSAEFSDLLTCIFTPFARNRITIPQLRARFQLLAHFYEENPVPAIPVLRIPADLPVTMKREVRGDDPTGSVTSELVDMHISNGVVDVRIAHSEVQPSLSARLENDSFVFCHSPSPSATSIAMASQSSFLSDMTSIFNGIVSMCDSEFESEPESSGPCTPLESIPGSNVTFCDGEDLQWPSDNTRLVHNVAARLRCTIREKTRSLQFWKRKSESKTSVDVSESCRHHSSKFRNAAKLVGSLVRIRSRETDSRNTR
ncbi:kinase-like protein [Rickenella mellea]|uniref:non-specific serine/threonine protein kinase n=1 Tax=Rickenella mellea TaxID=50990 RepID=A0A4Y7QA20_9AGAM|nr:kinase-like protein [Rickenella mellea]